MYLTLLDNYMEDLVLLILQYVKLLMISQIISPNTELPVKLQKLHIIHGHGQLVYFTLILNT